MQIFNKIDLAEYPARVDRNEQGEATRIWLSAKTGEGFDAFKDIISEIFADQTHHCEITLSADEGHIRSRLYESKVIDSESYNDDGSIRITLNISEVQIKKISRHLEISAKRFHMCSDRLAGVA